MPRAKNNTRSWQRTAKLYREKGYTVVQTEYSSRGLRHDLLGFIDGLGLTFGATVGLQACGGKDFAEHVRKITIEKRAEAEHWLMAGNEIHLVGWRKVGDRGKRKTWQPRIQFITLEDLQR